jgi:uncharacterized protein YbaA (DUF1428 family)
MGKYVDGFLLPIQKRHLQTYRRISRAAGKVWRKYGALEYREWAGDDLTVTGVVPFPRTVRSKPGETVVFSWIVYRSRKHRDAVNGKVMKDPYIKAMVNKKSPFDLKRMAYGGFKVIVDIKPGRKG